MEGLKRGDRVTFVFLNIDVVHSSLLPGSSGERFQIFENFAKYVHKKISDHHGDTVNWAKEGGIFFFYSPNVLDESNMYHNAVLSAIDILEGLNTFNLSNIHSVEEIKTRIAIHAGESIYHGNHSQIESADLSLLAKNERDLGSSNAVVITERVFNQLDESGKLKRIFLETSRNFKEIKLYAYPGQADIPDKVVTTSSARLDTSSRDVSASRSIEPVETKVKAPEAEPKFSDEVIRAMAESAKWHLSRGSYGEVKVILAPVVQQMFPEIIPPAQIPLFKDVYVTYSTMLSTLEDYDELDKITGEALNRHDAPEFWYFKARADLHSGRYDRSRQILERLLSEEPQKPQFLRLSALLDWESGNTDSAIDRAQLALQVEHSLAAENSLIYYLAARGRVADLKEARERGEKLLQVQGDNPAVIDTWAFVLYRLGENGEAQKFADQACELAPKVGAAYYTYGLILRAMDKAALSKLCLQQAISLEKPHVRIRREAEKSLRS